MLTEIFLTGNNYLKCFQPKSFIIIFLLTFFKKTPFSFISPFGIIGVFVNFAFLIIFFLELIGTVNTNSYSSPPLNIIEFR